VRPAPPLSKQNRSAVADENPYSAPQEKPFVQPSVNDEERNGHHEADYRKQTGPSFAATADIGCWTDQFVIQQPRFPVPNWRPEQSSQTALLAPAPDAMSVVAYRRMSDLQADGRLVIFARHPIA
jgi:hypothetical protein